MTISCNLSYSSIMWRVDEIHPLLLLAGWEASSQKIGLVFFLGLADVALWTLISSRPDDRFFVVSRTV